MQKNWIGKSIGCEIEFKIKENKVRLKFLQQDQILYLELVLSLSVDHKLSELFQK